MRRALGDGHSAVSASLFPQQTSSASLTSQAIFPTRTTATDYANAARTPPNLYLIFLGVLLFLLVLSGTLAVRAIRIRRRYQLAVQAAIANGDPLPVWDPRGFGSGLPRQLWDDRTSFFIPSRASGKKDFGPTPLMHEYHLKESGPVEWATLQPLSILECQPKESVAGPRADGSHPHRGESATSHTTPGMIDERCPRAVQVAVVVQMPTEALHISGEPEDETGWQAGMELGVWEVRCTPENKL